jgi:hypothetical protein
MPWFIATILPDRRMSSRAGDRSAPVVDVNLT